jgi:hypothetical protein
MNPITPSSDRTVLLKFEILDDCHIVVIDGVTSRSESGMSCISVVFRLHKNLLVGCIKRATPITNMVLAYASLSK